MADPSTLSCLWIVDSSNMGKEKRKACVARRDAWKVYFIAALQHFDFNVIGEIVHDVVMACIETKVISNGRAFSETTDARPLKQQVKIIIFYVYFYLQARCKSTKSEISLLN